MSETTASYRLNVYPQQRSAPFVLRVGENLGSRPVQLYPLWVNAWSQQAGVYDHLLPMAVRMKWPGQGRIRLYCSQRPESEIRLLVRGGGRYRCLGRRMESRTEILTWVRSSGEFLRYGYDQPTVTILDRTRFYDSSGQESTAPVYEPSLGRFRHDHVVTGALVVSYQTGYFLYEIEYDSGAGELTETALRALKLAWLAGNIHDAMIPPVQVIALSGQQATQFSFARRFWPEHASATLSFQDEEAPPPTILLHGGGLFYVNPDRMSNCWLQCRERIKPGATVFTRQELDAIEACLTNNASQGAGQYVESQRESRSERIYSLQDPNVYIDVKRAVAVTFKRQLDGGCGVGAGQAPTIRLRFNNASSAS